MDPHILPIYAGEKYVDLKVSEDEEEEEVYVTIQGSITCKTCKKRFYPSYSDRVVLLCDIANKDFGLVCKSICLMCEYDLLTLWSRGDPTRPAAAQTPNQWNPFEGYLGHWFSKATWDGCYEMAHAANINYMPLYVIRKCRADADPIRLWCDPYRLSSVLDPVVIEHEGEEEERVVKKQKV